MHAKLSGEQLERKALVYVLAARSPSSRPPAGECYQARLACCRMHPLADPFQLPAHFPQCVARAARKIKSGQNGDLWGPPAIRATGRGAIVRAAASEWRDCGVSRDRSSAVEAPTVQPTTAIRVVR